MPPPTRYPSHQHPLSSVFKTANILALPHAYLGHHRSSWLAWASSSLPAILFWGFGWRRRRFREGTCCPLPSRCPWATWPGTWGDGPSCSFCASAWLPKEWLPWFPVSGALSPQSGFLLDFRNSAIAFCTFHSFSTTYLAFAADWSNSCP